ncbi:PepSY domain-containing protein [Nocardia brasiliensis]|uniref:PepSY domain-containing protein n=1 Tax=Nocardia brasiliensis TaxID=37326 RepID=UPI00068CF136|nr:PepSY domain-containing protein [Nocardia brasiliensis]
MLYAPRRPGSGLRKLTIGATLAVALIGGSAVAGAQPAVTEQEALDAARNALMGATVQSIEFDTSDGAPKWEIDVKTRDGGGYEVAVDARTGTIVSIDEDND